MNRLSRQVFWKASLVLSEGCCETCIAIDSTTESPIMQQTPGSDAANGNYAERIRIRESVYVVVFAANIVERAWRSCSRSRVVRQENVRIASYPGQRVMASVHRTCRPGWTLRDKEVPCCRACVREVDSWLFAQAAEKERRWVARRTGWALTAGGRGEVEVLL